MTTVEHGEPVWPIFGISQATAAEFVQFWSGLYEGYDEAFYVENIRQELTQDRVENWFKWKNGGPLSQQKRQSISRYHLEESRLPGDASDEALERFLLQSGGVVWRVFLVHLQHPDRFPIYDQHVHRAMAFLDHQEQLEVPIHGPTQVRCYHEYCRFFNQLAASGCARRDIDRALWALGKFLKSNARRELLCRARGSRLPHTVRHSSE